MFDRCGKRVLGEVYSSNNGVVGQGIDNRLDGRRGGRCLSGSRHEGMDRSRSCVQSRGDEAGDGRTRVQGTN